MSASKSRAIPAAELDDVSKALASLALARMKQDGSLRVRQREQLRRALTTAGDRLGWVTLRGGLTDRVKRATKDVTRLADAGTQALEGELAAAVADKKREIAQLSKVAASVQSMADDDDASFPAEIEYSHTARTGTKLLVTRTETLTLSDRDEALNTAAMLEKRIEGWEKLRDQMLVDLKDRQRQLRALKDSLSGFVDSSKGLVGEVLATLY